MTEELRRLWHLENEKQVQLSLPPLLKWNWHSVVGYVLAFSFAGGAKETGTIVMTSSHVDIDPPYSMFPIYIF